jgi:eukaryotic-like serine/threonine-protein kinase
LDPERWQKVKELFDAALELAPEERARYLEETSAGDADLRREVEQLLAAHAEAGTFIDRPAVQDATDLFAGDAQLGQRIGPYKIVRLLGRGGMGSVFLGLRDDDQFQKRVAIKLVKRGMDSEEVLRRFRGERQILASLDHPNIARLLDGGVTPEGLPFFVMEYIEGEPIDQYCDRMDLGVTEHLELFRKVCSAVQYAHQNLVVHRDIKPGNILVTADGAPKLLDFGIAKLLQPDLFPQTVLPTQTGLRLMTPEYASPEQVRGENVTTASDVYSLGVLLFQLLTGRLPYRLDSRIPTEIERAICEVEPKRPSTAIDGDAMSSETRKLQRRLAGDLDNIVLMALRKEAQRRYASVEQLAADIRRHLEGLPVVARPDTFSYRASKFVRRNRLPIAASILVFLSLVGGIIATTWQARIARTQRDLAVEAAATMVEELAEGMRKMSGPTEGRLGLLVKAEEVFAKVTESGLTTRDLQRRTAEAHRVLAQTYQLLGNARGALRHAEQGERRALALARASGGSLEHKAALVGLRVEKGDALASLGREREAQVAYDAAHTLAEEISKDPAATPKERQVLPLCLQRQGDRALAAGDLPRAEKLFLRSHQVSRELVTHNGSDPAVLSTYANDLERLGDVLYAAGKATESCARYREALDVRRRARELTPADVTVLQSLANSTLNVGWCSDLEGHVEPSASLHREGIALLRRLADSDPGNARLASMLIGGLGSLGGVYVTAKRPAEALPPLREAYERVRALRDRNPGNPAVAQKTAAIADIYSRALRQEGRLDEAAPVAESAVAAFRGLVREHPENVEFGRSLGYALIAKGKILQAQDRIPEAITTFREALELREAIARSTHASQDKQLIAESHFQLAKGIEAGGNRSEARRILLEGRKLLLDLRAAGQLSDDSEGWRAFLPAIESMLKEIS